MSNDACDRVLFFIQSQAKGRINLSVRTRLIAYATAPRIY